MCLSVTAIEFDLGRDPVTVKGRVDEQGPIDEREIRVPCTENNMEGAILRVQNILIYVSPAP